jgi:RimJ/RimL family protein N-acetyltransferase
MTLAVTLVPLSSEHHVDALQQVYRSVPTFWQRYGLIAPPDGQAKRDLSEAETTAGRTMMGIVRRLEDEGLETGFEMIGLVDFRLYWPRQEAAYVGMIMVAEALQRQGVGTQAWQLLADWLSDSTSVEIVRLGVEQNNPGALHFFRVIGFELTGETNRISVGEKWLRLLYMEQSLPVATRG